MSIKKTKQKMQPPSPLLPAATILSLKAFHLKPLPLRAVTSDGLNVLIQGYARLLRQFAQLPNFLFAERTECLGVDEVLKYDGRVCAATRCLLLFLFLPFQLLLSLLVGRSLELRLLR